MWSTRGWVSCYVLKNKPETLEDCKAPVFSRTHSSVSSNEICQKILVFFFSGEIVPCLTIDRWYLCSVSSPHGIVVVAWCQLKQNLIAICRDQNVPWTYVHWKFGKKELNSNFLELTETCRSRRVFWNFFCFFSLVYRKDPSFPVAELYELSGFHCTNYAVRQTILR